MVRKPRAREQEDAGLSVQTARDPLSVHPARYPLSVYVADATDTDEPEEYGLRVNWQSEAVRIEAAEFLVATRVQHHARIRAAHDLEVLRHKEEDEER